MYQINYQLALTVGSGESLSSSDYRIVEGENTMLSSGSSVSTNSSSNDRTTPCMRLFRAFLPFFPSLSPKTVMGHTRPIRTTHSRPLIRSIIPFSFPSHLHIHRPPSPTGAHGPYYDRGGGGVFVIGLLAVLRKKERVGRVASLSIRRDVCGIRIRDGL